MAQILARHPKLKAKPKIIVAESVPTRQNIRSLEDWDTYLHNIWLEIMKTNPGFYLDAKVSHHNGTCSCKCTRNLYLTDVHYRKNRK